MELVMGCKYKPQTRKENLHWAGSNTLVHLDVGHMGLRLRRTTIKIAIYGPVVELVDTSDDRRPVTLCEGSTRAVHH